VWLKQWHRERRGARPRSVRDRAKAIAAAGATLRYVPQYSPDLNPIEMPYSKFKVYMRRLARAHR
jgi:transposase